MLAGQDRVNHRRAIRGDGDRRRRRGRALRQAGGPRHLDARDLGRRPRSRGVEHVKSGDHVTQEDLEDVPDAELGDALLVRTCRRKTPRVHPDSPARRTTSTATGWRCPSVQCASWPTAISRCWVQAGSEILSRRRSLTSRRSTSPPRYAWACRSCSPCSSRTRPNRRML